MSELFYKGFAEDEIIEFEGALGRILKNNTFAIEDFEHGKD